MISEDVAGSVLGHRLRRPFLVDSLRQAGEARLDVLPRLCAREGERSAISPSDLLDFRFSELRPVAQVPLVREELNGDLARDAVHALDPVIEIVERRPAGDIAYGEDSSRAVEIRLLEELTEPLLPHDIPDRHV